MIAAASNSQILRKRLFRFLQSKESAMLHLNQTLRQIHHTADAYIFGGMIRDIGLFGINQFKSDIDIVFDSSKDELIKTLEKLNLAAKQNKFGGFRISDNNIIIDIWALSDTWAFKSGLVTLTGVESLLSTTLMNWDAILYNLSSRKIICSADYFENLASGHIDIVLGQNPNELGSIVRVLRAIYGKNANSIGEKAVTLLENGFNKFNFQDIIEYEKQSYSNSFLNHTLLKRTEKIVYTKNENLEKIEVGKCIQLSLKY
jgi:predicted nucleotidyltransferase